MHNNLHIQPNKTINQTLQQFLDHRKEASLFRSLQVQTDLIDFCSNDYLSLARSQYIRQKVNKEMEEYNCLSGSTGSRSISGNTLYAEELENKLASFHHAEAALLFNSGYDANIGLFSSIAKKGDSIITDELIHASIIDGCRLSYANRFRFMHNNITDLEKKLQQAQGNIFVAVESVYSMDGDTAPLNDIINLCRQYNANLIVDEAHATGIFGTNGRGLVNHCGLENEVFARIHTFGKAIGAHGAVVAGSSILRHYLINTARSFIFTTALPMHSLATVNAAYDQLISNNINTQKLNQHIQQFRNRWINTENATLISSISPVQCIIIPGNERVRNCSAQLQQLGFDVRAIISPSVPVGKERLRISLHLHNTSLQVDNLISALQKMI